MDKSEFDIEKLFANVRGFLSVDEAELLYRLASEVPSNGVIVEIGSYQGRSTICLGMGAKRANASVYAIDPHEDFKISDDVSYGMENHAALLRNLIAYDVADVVRVVALPSLDAVMAWGYDVKLIFIDGDHEYTSVRNDLIEWASTVSDGKILLHDSSGHFPGVDLALKEFLAHGFWKITERVDATTVLERA